MKTALQYLVLMVIIMPAAIYAQTLESDITSLSKGSDLIFTAKVTAQKSEWNENRTAIFTRVTLNVDEYIKGNSQNTITVVHPGGEVGSVGELYTHIPVFKQDEQVLLFVKKRKSSNDFTVYEGENGKINLITDENGEKVTSQRKKISQLKDEIKKALSEK